LEKTMPDNAKKPLLIGYLAMFGGIYFGLLYVAGLVMMYTGDKTDVNVPVLMGTGVVVSSTFTYRRRRLLTRVEALKLSLGTFAIDLVIQVGVTLVMVEDRAWLTAWGIWFVLLLHFILILFTFGYLAKVAGKPFLAALEKKNHKNTPESPRPPTDGPPDTGASA
jgi:hypothetical protein